MSLRLAIKRSLEGAEPPPAARPPLPLAPKPPQPQPQQTSLRIVVRKPPRPPAVQLPKIDKCVRNSDPAAIDDVGFVEVSSALPDPLIKELYQEAADKVARHEAGAGGSSPRKRRQPPSAPPPGDPEVEEISNALQTDVSPALLERVKAAMEDCDAAKRTMSVLFGKPSPHAQVDASNYRGFVLETPKVLITKPGSNPQLPHADDHCSSCVICLIHLRDGQEPTRVAKYNGRHKDYPTGITVGCDSCNRTEQLPDRDFRRGVHLTDEKWHCDCSQPHTPYDFEGKLTRAFSELLHSDAPSLCDSYAGPCSPRAGDGMLGVPMLVHRGPGLASDATENRMVLFLTLRPVYRNLRGRGIDEIHHKYNPALQIHASCILYNQFKKVNEIYERSGCGLEGYFSAIVGAETASLMREVKRLKEENRCLKEQAGKRRRKQREKDKRRKEMGAVHPN